MEKFEHISVKGLDFNPKKMGDLLYYDGALLSHFQDPNQPKEHYFYRWVDNDDQVNRWLIFKNTDAEVLSFFNKSCGELDLIQKNNALTLLDLDDNLNKVGIYVSSLTNIPSAYLPTNKAFFDENRYESYALTLKKKLETTLQEENILFQILKKVQNLEKEQKSTKKILSELLTK